MKASWFCIQCLARFGQRLGISLLELNTFAHAICTMAIYLAWWSKPLDVEEPVQIRADSELEYQTIATMCCHSELDGKRCGKWCPCQFRFLYENHFLEEKDGYFPVHIFHHKYQERGPGGCWKFETTSIIVWQGADRLRDLTWRFFHYFGVNIGPESTWQVKSLRSFGTFACDREMANI